MHGLILYWRNSSSWAYAYLVLTMYERGNYRPVVLTVMENVNEIMDWLKHKGIIFGWEVGDYI